MCLRNLFSGMDCTWILFIIILILLCGDDDIEEGWDAERQPCLSLYCSIQDLPGTIQERKYVRSAPYTAIPVAGRGKAVVYWKK